MSRSNNISPSRVRLEEFLKAAKRPYSCIELAEAIGVTSDHMSRIITSMRYCGRIKNVTPENRTCAQYVYQERPQAPKGPETVRVERFVPTQPLKWTPAKPARIGAADHESIPSRRADGYKPHQPMMLMGSGIRGEAGR